ncbi:dipeptide ABC transporter ATP-binding protein [Persicimonas caeni]|uniref:Dipeptide ABC transporter ATP-binding protein n=1 Tax=Persicimonas caeni TaxID=2292766 RepID=A0A4Y6Q1H6_PERCE|nr:dipeptide ABC transporter ATP-binding protein [Persicimonas caeni]QDG54441.1 dipeptide ABC transporter ATP-binding protein [Persicimonas caeni]QED35662.1 dipeptide ABC transporter ATP-binding protein [Persicimonas caeni]
MSTALKKENPKMSANTDREPLVRVRNLQKYFPIKKGIFNRHVGDVKAVDGVSFDVFPNETLGLVGESGCGKTTTGRTLLNLLEPTGGKVYFRDDSIYDLSEEQMRALRRKMQIIFQDPYSSLNPRMTIENIIGEAMEFHGIASGDERRQKVENLLERVGLQPSYITRYPHEFSGGQRQRIGIARALALNPDFIVCDEAVSALDVSVQAQVINLLQDLQEEFNLSYLFIAHDLSVVKHISDRIAVMYLGQVAELAETDDLFDNPLHPYTQSLLSAIPVPDPKRKKTRVILKGDVPSPINPPSGCRFHTRCPACFAPCDNVEPRSIEAEPGHFVRCHLYDPEYAPKDASVFDRLPVKPRHLASPDEPIVEADESAPSAADQERDEVVVETQSDGGNSADAGGLEESSTPAATVPES